jgi:hypothetical protein
MSAKKKNIYENVDVKGIIEKYFALKRAGKKEEAEEYIKNNLPVPAHHVNATILAFGRNVFADMGFKIIEQP